MAPVRGERVRIGQANGKDIDLIVHGDEDYARYETPDGYPVIYDAASGVFFHARLVNGRFESTGVPADRPPPPGALPHLEESPHVRRERAQARRRGRT